MNNLAPAGDMITRERTFECGSPGSAREKSNMKSEGVWLMRATLL